MGPAAGAGRAGPWAARGRRSRKEAGDAAARRGGPPRWRVTRGRPPQAGDQARTSMISTRGASRAAQVPRPGRLAAPRRASRLAGGGLGARAAVADNCERRPSIRGQGCRDTKAVRPRVEGGWPRASPRIRWARSERDVAIAPHRLELDEDASIGAEAILGERGAEGDSDRACSRRARSLARNPDAGWVKPSS